MSRRNWFLVILGVSVLCGVAILIACGGGNGGTKTMGSTVNVTLSDPSTCAAPNGAFSHIYVTVMDVQINSSASAGDNDSNWQSVIPDKKGTPQQVDLLGAADTECFLRRLGSTSELQAGSYQQIRVILADDSHLPSGNACGSSANCVMLTNDPHPEAPTPYPLLLSSETKTGIKIPTSQISGGQFTIGAGQTKDLNIDFNACASIVTQGNGGYRLKPVLHVGEVTTVNAINGTVVDQNGSPISGSNIIVALEYNVGGTEVVKRQVTPDANGHFSFCPVDALDSGTYDVVAVAIGDNNVAYGMTITTGVAPGTALGNVKLFAAGAPATVNGLVTSSKPNGSSTTGTPADVALAAVQQITINNSPVNFLVPLASQDTVVMPLSTESDATCPANTFCKKYSMIVPAANPTVGAFSATGTQYVQGTGTATYFVNAQAVVPKSGGTPDCTQPNMTTASFTVTAGNPTTAPDINFTGCQ